MWMYRTCLVQPSSAEVCIRPRRKPTATPTSGLTSIFGGTSLKGLRPAAVPGLPSPPLAAILELLHSLGNFQWTGSPSWRFSRS